MKRLPVLLLVFLLTAGAERANEDAAAEDLKRMEGDWVVASMEVEGMKVPDDDAMALFRSVKGDRYTVSRYRKVVGKGTIKLDATKKPRAIDALPDGATHKTKPLLGIYEFEGNKMKLCFARPGMARPTEFRSKEDSGHTLTVWQREKE
ncbi:MAG TPA: TIGR03067 domain-containing protein [Gemmataceae bacterium]|nr:TIGR03067 domain-containing protein [Gemmataceae bacterium]